MQYACDRVQEKGRLARDQLIFFRSTRKEMSRVRVSYIARLEHELILRHKAEGVVMSEDQGIVDVLKDETNEGKD
jgi:hypothetical protein